MKVIDGKKYYSIGELSQILNKQRLTILRWYEYEETQEVKLLPPYIRIGETNGGVRYWAEDEIYKFDEFFANKKHGDMTKISNKYNGVHKKNRLDTLNDK